MAYSDPMRNSKISKHEYGDIESRRERKRKRIKERNPEIERKTEKNHQHQFFQLVGAENAEQAQSKGVWALRKAEQPKLIKSTYLQQGFKKGFSNIASVLFLFEIALLLVLYNSQETRAHSAFSAITVQQRSKLLSKWLVSMFTCNPSHTLISQPFQAARSSAFLSPKTNKLKLAFPHQHECHNVISRAT